MNERTDREKMRRRVRANFVGGAGGGLFALFFTVLTFKAWYAFHSPVALAYFIACFVILGISLRLTLRSYRIVAKAGEKAGRYAVAEAQRSQQEDGQSE